MDCVDAEEPERWRTRGTVVPCSFTTRESPAIAKVAVSVRHAPIRAGVVGCAAAAAVSNEAASKVAMRARACRRTLSRIFIGGINRAGCEVSGPVATGDRREGKTIYGGGMKQCPWLPGRSLRYGPCTGGAA